MNRLFTRIMAVVLLAIVLLTAVLSGISFFALRSQRISARLDYLASEAEDIADLAADDQSGSLAGMFLLQDSRRYLNWKAQKVNEEFGAYIAVVDRWGNVMDNIRTAYSEDPDFVASLSGEEISAAMKRVLTGETIRVQTLVGNAPTFTVGVPYRSYGSVAGAVFIQTKAQRIQSGMEDLIWIVGATALGVLVFSGVLIGLYLRGVMRPLGDLTRAAGAMAEGDFDVPVDEQKGTEEIRQLSGVFNAMRKKLRGVENSRREFVANVSHELRSPITSIRGFAEGMADGVIPPEEHPKYLRLVADESLRLSGLVGELLELSRLEREDAKADRTVFDMNEMLRRAVIRRISDLDEKRLDVDCDFRADPCPVVADSPRMEEVVINLLDNAVKFTGEEGRIVLRTEIRGGDAEVTVWDNGAEIPEEDREKVFDRFFTADRAHTSGKGTGLGLSICQRVLEMHGREIRLLTESEIRAAGWEGGTAFRFWLDSAPASAEPAADSPEEKGSRTGSRIRKTTEESKEQTAETS